jgi:hypothetical protein
MNHRMANALAKALLILFRLKVISFNTYDKAIDQLTVMSIMHELNKEDKK